MQRAIPATLMRGGTSKDLYLDARDLPQDETTRDSVLLALMGSPDARQIDGVGGAHMGLLAAGQINGVVSTRMFIPHRVHESIGVLAAVSVATACAMGEIESPLQC